MGIIETIKMITREESVEEGIGREEEKKDFVKSILADTDFDYQKLLHSVRLKSQR